MNTERSPTRLKRRIWTMETLRDRGPEANRQIPAVILPEGYNGKILLVSVSDGVNEKTVILRSGDLWHREILRSTETEIRDLGFTGVQVDELGGALVSFEPDGAIIIYGNSHEFGACDKDYAAELVQGVFPGRQVKVRD